LGPLPSYFAINRPAQGPARPAETARR